MRNIVIIVLLSAYTACAGVYYLTDGTNVTRHKGDTPYPAGAIYNVAIPSALPADHLIYDNGKIREKTAAEKMNSGLTEAQITDRNTCLASLASLLADFQITLPIQPALAMSQMFAYWQAHPEDATLTAKAQQVQFLYTRLRIEYGMTDPQIGGLE